MYIFCKFLCKSCMNYCVQKKNKKMFISSVIALDLWSNTFCTKCMNKILLVHKMHTTHDFTCLLFGHHLRAGARRWGTQLVAAGMLTAFDNVTARGRRERVLQRHVDTQHDFTWGAHISGRWIGQGRLIRKKSLATDLPIVSRYGEVFCEKYIEIHIFFYFLLSTSTIFYRVWQ